VFTEVSLIKAVIIEGGNTKTSLNAHNFSISQITSPAQLKGERRKK
jgi:hypothetical protein